MTIEFTKNEKVKITMKDYVTECIEAFAENVNEGASTPTKSSLFQVNEESPRLDRDRSEIFQRIMDKLRYVTKRARVDISITVIFLCT